MMIRIGTILLGLLLGAFLFWRGVSAQGEDYLPPQYVIQISVDGLRADLLAERLANDPDGRYPNFERLRQEGASTFNARTDDTYTNTMPNHTSMLTGRPVAQIQTYPPTAYHGYTTNHDPWPDWTLHKQGNPLLDYVASTFDVAHDHGLRTALFTGKSKFAIYEQSYNAQNGAPDEIGEDNGRDKIDQYVYNEDTAALLTQYLQEMAADPYHYSFFHFRDPDSAGHDQRWGSREWDQAVQDVDGYLGQVLDLVEHDERLRGHTAIILTADHGGLYSYHWNYLAKANYTIPVFLWSPGNIPANVDLYDFYARSFADPGQGRVTYAQKPQPIRNGSTGNLALHLLGLPPVPGAVIDAPLFITHCNIEDGETYDFGQTMAKIEVIEAGTDRCVSVGLAESEDTDQWRVVPYGAGYVLNLILPGGEQMILTSENCDHIQQQGQICDLNKASETAVAHEVIMTASMGEVGQQPVTWQWAAALVFTAVGVLAASGGIVLWRHRA